MYMLDTATCVYVINERDAALRATFIENVRDICISAITHAELCYGVAHSARVEHNRGELDGFLRELDIRAFDVAAGRHYGDIRESLTRRGVPIGANDGLIAAHARSLDATLVTNNSKEFDRVPDLQTANWIARAGS